jgi:Flp pilus assembly pilin Flp
MLARATKFIMKLGESESGLDAVEYFLIAGLITLVALASVASLHSQLRTTFGFIGSVLTRTSA